MTPNSPLVPMAPGSGTDKRRIVWAPQQSGSTLGARVGSFREVKTP
jgi:hypothetical protein